MWFISYGIIIFILAWTWQKYSDKKKCLPPGPFRFPGIGCIVQVLLQHTHPYVAFQKLAEYYGNVFSVQIGLNRGVVINGFDAIKEVLHNDDWLGRLDEKFLLDRTFGKPLGLVGGQRDIWLETRKYCTRNLREFGLGNKSTLESLVQVELAEFSSQIFLRIEKSSGVLSGFPLFEVPIANIVWSITSGKRFDYEDPKLTALCHNLNAFVKAGSLAAGPLTSYPFLCDWAPKLVGFDKLHKANVDFQNYLKDVLEDTRTLGEYLTNPTNFIELFLQEIEKRKPNGTIEDIVYHDENLIAILIDLFAGGTDVPSAVLSVGILRLVLNPLIQKNVQDEIDSVIGSRRCPLIKDKEKMPYTEATIHEIIRIANVAPISPRKLDKDATIGNYRIPKGNTVFVNFYSVSMDPEFWGDPEVFRPERFLKSNGKITNAERMLTFSAGRRNCIGESVARTTIFIMLTGLLQQFKFSVNPAEGKPSTEYVLGMTITPKPFTVIVTPRY